MRSMRVRHVHQIRYGERLHARTWIRGMRRDGMLCTRQVELRSERGLMCEGTQQWVHVTSDLKPRRADPALLAAFPVRDEGADVSLPTAPRDHDHPAFGFDVEVWHGWMDPLDHVNHPAYLDWTDESLFRRMHAGGVNPQLLRPRYEHVVYLRGATATQTAHVQTRLEGVAENALCFAHEIRVGEHVCATVRSVRDIVGQSSSTLRTMFA